MVTTNVLIPRPQDRLAHLVAVNVLDVVRIIDRDDIGAEPGQLAAKRQRHALPTAVVVVAYDPVRIAGELEAVAPARRVSVALAGKLRPKKCGGMMPGTATSLSHKVRIVALLAFLTPALVG